MRTICAGLVIAISGAMLPPLWAQVETQPSTRGSFPRLDPVTRPATKPDPLAQPDAAIKHLFDLIKNENYDEIRRMDFEDATVTQEAKRFAATSKALRGGAKVVVLDSKIKAN